MAVRFGVFEVDLASGELRKQGLRIRLQEQPFAVLAALLERPGEVVTREELIARLWPDGTIVDFDRGLNAAVTRLRQALSDSAETPRYIETVARRGYRFVGMVDAPAAAAEIPAAVPTPEKPRRSPWPAAAAISAIVMAGAGYWLMAARSNPADPSWTVAPLTTEPGYEQHASFSPDGTQVTFQWGRDGGTHVFVKLVGTGDPVRLTSAVEAEYGPAWSPDGRQIAFLRDVDKQTIGIYVIPVLGGVERKVAETPAPSWANNARNPLRRLDWTRDSRHLVVSGPEQAGGIDRLLLVSIESGEKQWLTTGRSDPEVADREPAVSPDGRTVAFVRGTASESIYLLSLQPDLSPAGEPRLLTSGRNPAWTPDGRELVYRPLRLPITGLAHVDIRGGKPRGLPAFGEDSFLPTLSRTGRLAFSRGTIDINIWRQELVDGPTPPPPVPLISSTARDADARYSPDGTRIVFQSNRSRYAEIWTCASDGTRCSQLTAFNGALITGTPRWSPDNRTIAFDSAAEGRFHVYTIDAGGGPVRRLTTEPTTGAIPSWSHDGKWIYYASSATGRGEIWKVPSQGGASVQVTRNGGLVAFESPDGTALYFTKTENDATLWRSGLDGSGETAVVQRVAHRGFAVSGDSIYYLRVEPTGETIRRFRLATREDTRVAGLAKTGYYGLALSPDGRYLLYSQIDQQGSDLMLVERFR
jgi:Tol biopolymer transport system component/DNA-binding winged helix-turn-helix (wHTH) protein